MFALKVFALILLISPLSAEKKDCSSAQVVIGDTFIFGPFASILSGKGEIGTDLLAVLTDQADEIDKADSEDKVRLVVDELLAYIKENPGKKKEVEQIKIPLFGTVDDLLASCSGSAEEAISEQKAQLLIEFHIPHGREYKYSYGLHGHPSEGPAFGSYKILVGAHSPLSEMGRKIKQVSRECGGDQAGERHLQFLEEWKDSYGNGFLVTAEKRKMMKLDKSFVSSGPIAIVGRAADKCGTTVPVYALRRHPEDTMYYTTDADEYETLRKVHEDEGIAFYGWPLP